MRLEVVERVGADERAELADLWVEAWAAAMPAIDFQARRGWFDERLIALTAAGARLVLCRDTRDGVAGFLTLDPVGEIDQLAVAVSAQGGGIAKALLGEAKRLSAGALRLVVNAGNAPAVALYERSGFRRTGEGVNTLSGLPVWTMQWSRADG